MSFPIYDDEDGSEELSYQDTFRNIEPQPLDDVDCFQPFVDLNPLNNRIVLELTAIEFKEIFSALYNGAEITYPDRFLQIIVNFLKGIHCPPLMEEQECFEYPTYSAFMRYYPINPYIEPDTTPDGYLLPPFKVNGQNGFQDDEYEPFDIIVPFGAFELLAGWWDILDGVLPSIQISVQGAGKAFIKLLTVPFGGLAVIEVDNEPNLLDIIAGVVTSADNILDLNLDSISLPPETAKELIFELDIVGSGLHIIYIVFLPIFDDSSVPFRFGGGFRGVQLCNFVEQPTMGIENIRFDETSCELQTLVDGDWQIVSGWENWLNCIPEAGGGSGAAGANIKVTTRHLELGASVSVVGTTFSDAFVLNFTPTYTKMLVIISNIGLINSIQSRWAECNILWNGQNGDNPTIMSHQDTDVNPLTISDWWSVVVPNVAHDIKVQIRARTAGDTATVSFRHRINFTIIEFEDASDIFVEDIRINGEELQKKIGGVWITVTDSLKTLFDAVQATAATALANANSAITTNITQSTQIAAIVTVNNTQNSRLSDLEAQQIVQNNAISDNMDEIALHDTRMDNIDIINTDQQTRIEALEAASLNDLEFWFKEWSFLSSANGWSSPEATWTSGQGFKSSSAFNLLFAGVTFRDSKITHMKITGRRQSGGFGQSKITWANVDDYAILEWSGGTLLNSQWIHVGNKIVQPNVPAFYFSDFSGEFRIEGIKLLGRGANLFP